MTLTRLQVYSPRRRPIYSYVNLDGIHEILIADKFYIIYYGSNSIKVDLNETKISALIAAAE
jgi:hypothetical protein